MSKIGGEGRKRRGVGGDLTTYQISRVGNLTMLSSREGVVGIFDHFKCTQESRHWKCTSKKPGTNQHLHKWVRNNNNNNNNNNNDNNNNNNNNILFWEHTLKLDARKKN